MDNPFEAIKDHIDDIKTAVRIEVEADILTELVRVGLSRLITLRPKRGPDYVAALARIGEE